MKMSKTKFLRLVMELGLEVGDLPFHWLPKKITAEQEEEFLRAIAKAKIIRRKNDKPTSI